MNEAATLSENGGRAVFRLRILCRFPVHKEASSLTLAESLASDEHQPSCRGRRTAASVGRSSGRRGSALGRRTSSAERACAPRGEGVVDDHGGRRLLNVRAGGWQQAVAGSEAVDRAAHLDRESTRPWRCWNRPKSTRGLRPDADRRDQGSRIARSKCHTCGNRGVGLASSCAGERLSARTKSCRRGPRCVESH
jgi:hypothetical protein